jgi:hypothetical protein
MTKNHYTLKELIKFGCWNVIYRFDELKSISEDNELFRFIKRNDRLIGLYLYECENNQCSDDANKLRSGILPNIILLFFTMLGYGKSRQQDRKIFKENA